MASNKVKDSEIFEVEKQLLAVSALNEKGGKEVDAVDPGHLSRKEERCVSRIKILWSFISFWISLADVTVIIYVSYLHFQHSVDHDGRLIAWLMLIPILLNFIGIFTFLSDDAERHEMEDLGECRRLKNLMFFPVIGPTASSLKLFAYSLEEKNAEKFERLESLLTKMKQYESYFRAAPEAFIQMSYRIITWSTVKEFHAEDYWTTVCLALCLFALAESNMYGPVLPYYRIFQRVTTKDAWKIEHIGIRWRVGLFFFAFLSIASRILADAIFKAAVCFYFGDRSFGELMIVSFLFQFLLRAGIYGVTNSYFGSRRVKKKVADEGVYGAFTYSWRSLFLSFDYQSFCWTVFLYFYLENLVMIGASYAVIYIYTDVDLIDKYIFHIYAGLAIAAMVIAITLKIIMRNRWRRKNSKKLSAP